MRNLRILMLLVTLTIAGAGVASGEDNPAKKDSMATAELRNQTHCPVMGGKIDSTAYTDIQGQRVYHCCPMCTDKLKADPDKYFKKAAEESIVFENIQTVCPVSGEELEKKESYADFEGRRVYFCCEKCIVTFAEDPRKYLSKLDATPSDEKESGSETVKTDRSSQDHGSHGH